MLASAAAYYAAASIGGLAVALTIYFLGAVGVPAALGVSIAPPLTLPWLYKLIVWGGLWGLIFLLPLPITPLWLKCLLLTLAPVLAALVVFGPMGGTKMFWLDKGALAPLYIYLVNIPWGLATGYLGRMFGAH
ncbi:MAG: hypothetical protein VX871_12000 [Pseudomonadota bacterium]|nr:hypothetical protein [Pseudomonadota bacterium]